MKPAAEIKSYRDSHLGEGRSYHDKFRVGPHRSVIWEIEQGIILELFRRWRPVGPIRHLDFACGTGRILQLLGTCVDRSVGVDVSESMLAVAREENPGADLRLVDLTREQPFSNGSFDLITAFRFFPNAEEPLRDEAMHALTRLLAPEGLLIVNNHLRAEGTKMRLRAGLARLGFGGSARDRHCMRDEEIESLAGKYGLIVLEARELGFVPVLNEKHPGFPRTWLRWIESAANDRTPFRGFGNLKVYALRRGRSGADARELEAEIRCSSS